MLLAAVHLVQAISRSRFWGTPLPIWVSEDMEEVVVVGSVEELQELTGEKVRRGRWGGGGEWYGGMCMNHRYPSNEPQITK